MIGAYLISLLVFGMVLTEQWLIHHFWLRQVFMSEEDNLPDQAADVGEKAARGVAVERKKMEPATSVA